MGIYGYLYIVSNTHYYWFLTKINNFQTIMTMIDQFIKQATIREGNENRTLLYQR